LYFEINKPQYFIKLPQHLFNIPTRSSDWDLETGAANGHLS